MSIKVEPSELVNSFASSKKIKRMFASRGLNLKRTALAFLNQYDFLDKTSVLEIALRVIRDYDKRLAKEGVTQKDIKKDPKLLVQRVQNEVVTQVSDRIRTKYRGKKYRWLPSNAEEPDPQHQLRYGKIYTIGRGEMPGDRYGCKCGMEILVDDDNLNL